MKKLISIVLGFLALNVAASDFPSDTKLTISGGNSNVASTMSNEAFQMSYDGSDATLYHSDWRGTTAPTIDMTWTLQTPGNLDYLVYTPRSDGGINGNIGKLSILVKYAGKTDFVSTGNYNFGMSGTPARIDFSPALKNVSEVRFSVWTAASSDGNFFVNVAEIGLYRRAKETFDPLTLFTDPACTELKKGVTQKQIDACPVPVYRTVANTLRDPAKAAAYSEFRIGKFGAYYNPTLDAARNKTMPYGIMENPAGISVHSGEELIVLASDIPAGQNVSLKVQALGSGYGKGPSFTIVNGVNKLTMPSPLAPKGRGSFGVVYPDTHSGLIYVQYMVNEEKPLPPPVKLHFVHGGTENGYYDSRRHSREDFLRLLNTNPAGGDTVRYNEYFDVIGKYASVTFKKKALANAGARGRDFIDAMDTIVWLEWKFAGLLPPPLGYGGRHRTHAYFVNLPMGKLPGGGDVGAYASHFHTAYPDGKVMSLTTLAELLNEDDKHPTSTWALGHEHGHVNQVRPAFCWTGMGEVTNNIMSMYVQTRLGEYFPTSKITRRNSRMWLVGDYMKAMNDYFVTPHPYSGAGRDVWYMLVPVWQLHLYLSDVLGKGGSHGAGVYADVYEHYRMNDPNAGSRTAGEHQCYFVKLICEKAQLNLEDFFMAWGFLTPVNGNPNHYGSNGKSSIIVTQAMIDELLKTIRNYPKPTGAKEFQYITDYNVDLYKHNAAIVRGTGYSVKDGKPATVPEGWENVVAWELHDAKGTLKQVIVPKGVGILREKLFADGDKLYAVSAAGERIEVEKNEGNQ